MTGVQTCASDLYALVLAAGNETLGAAIGSGTVVIPTIKKPVYRRIPTYGRVIRYYQVGNSVEHSGALSSGLMSLLALTPAPERRNILGNQSLPTVVIRNSWSSA